MNDSIVLDKDYNLFQLAFDYHISEWRNDSTVDIEEKRLFRSFINRAIVYDKTDIDDVKIDITHSEFKHKNENAIGCLIAYETNNFVMSFKTHECWQDKVLNGKYSTLDNWETIDNPLEVEVLNVCESEEINHIKEHFSSEIEEKYKEVKCGKEILIHKEEWFPSIQFCDNAIKQLEKENTYINIQQIIKKLDELNDYFRNITGNFDVNALKHCTGESEATLKNYKDDHTFILPDGSEEIFSFHLRFTGTYAGRIFFISDEENRSCIIGHIGKKLKSVKYH